jgi:hypothetical protein
MSCTEIIYINSASDLRDKITRYDAIINALGSLVLDDTSAKAGIEEYQLDDGQTKIKTVYTTVASQARAIVEFERLKNKAINQLNGRQMVMRPHQGLR